MRLSKFLLKNVEYTLAILKPDVCKNPIVLKEIKEQILQSGFYVYKSKQLILSRSNAQKFYGEHKGKFFFDRLVTFMSSGWISVHVLAKENAIINWRELMGPTKVYRTRYEAENTIRGKYGLTDTRNGTHGSDSKENAEKEIKFFFEDFDESEFFKWMTLVSEEKVNLDHEVWEHKFKYEEKIS